MRTGELRGYNTDAEGFLQALLEHGIKPKGKKVVVLGAGGASRAITYILAEKGARVTIVNRQPEHRLGGGYRRDSPGKPG